MNNQGFDALPSNHACSSESYQEPSCKGDSHSLYPVSNRYYAQKQFRDNLQYYDDYEHGPFNHSLNVNESYSRRMLPRSNEQVVSISGDDYSPIYESIHPLLLPSRLIPLPNLPNPPTMHRVIHRLPQHRALAFPHGVPSDIYYPPNDHICICSNDSTISMNKSTKNQNSSYTQNRRADPLQMSQDVFHSNTASFPINGHHSYYEPQYPEDFSTSSGVDYRSHSQAYVPTNHVYRHKLQNRHSGSYISDSDSRDPKYYPTNCDLLYFSKSTEANHSSSTPYSKVNHMMNKMKNLPPGETNPSAHHGTKLCFEYMNTGKCHRVLQGHCCHYRHLVTNHPDAIADRFKSGLLTEDEILQYGLRPCEEDEINPFAPIEAPLCFETHDMKICRYRHLLPEHREAIEDRERSLVDEC